MIPFRDSRRPRRIAWVTWCLALAFVGIFAAQVRSGAGSEWATSWGLVPERWTRPASPGEFLAGVVGLVTAPLLHGSVLHLAGNLIFLTVFGNDLEERLGSRRYFVFFLLAASASGFGEILTDPYSEVPRIGASGAISALLGAYLVAFPRVRLQGVLPLGCLWLPTQSPAWLFLGIWFLTQLLLSWIHLDHPFGGGIAWMAHVTGFLAGPLLLLALDPKRQRRKWLSRG